MTFRFGQAEARISVALLPLAVFCIVTGEVTELLCATLALLVHEVAHAIAAKNAGFRIERIAFYPFGAVMKLDGGPIDRDLFWSVAAAGPVCSLTAAGVLQLVKPLFGASEITALLIRVNLAIGLINLLPAYPLDGGRILCAALLKTLRERTARTVALILTALLSLIMTGIGILLIIRGKPVRGIVAVPAFLLTAAIREWRIPKTGTVARVMERRDALKTGTPQRTVTYTVPDHFIVGDAVALLSERCYTVFRVRTKSNIFELDEGDILDAAAKFGMQEPLKTVIRD